MALLTLTGQKITRISCHHLCIAQDAFPVHALLCRCPSMCRSTIRPHHFLAASCSSGDRWTTLALQGIAHQLKASHAEISHVPPRPGRWQSDSIKGDFDSSVHVDAGRAPVAGHAWWSGGPLFDVKTGKAMVHAAATYLVGCNATSLQCTSVVARRCPKLSCHMLHQLT